MALRAATAVLPLTAAALLTLGAPAGAVVPRSPGDRAPHSRVVTYDRAGVRVVTLQLALRPRRGRLAGRLALAVRNTTDAPVRRQVRVGRCVGGIGNAPACPTSLRLTLVVPARGVASVRRDVSLPMPPARRRAVRVLVSAPPGPHHHGPLIAGAVTDAELLLHDSWTGARAGRAFGARLDDRADAARRVWFDLQESAPTHGYVGLRWLGAEAPAAATTELGGRPIHASRMRSGPGDFDTRIEGLKRRGATALRAVVLDGTATVIDARLPWPA